MKNINTGESQKVNLFNEQNTVQKKSLSTNFYETMFPKRNYLFIKNQAQAKRVLKSGEVDYIIMLPNGIGSFKLKDFEKTSNIKIDENSLILAEGCANLSMKAIDYILANKVKSGVYYGDQRTYYCNLISSWGEESGLYEVIINNYGSSNSEFEHPLQLHQIYISLCSELVIARRMEEQSFNLESERLKRVYQNHKNDTDFKIGIMLVE